MLTIFFHSNKICLSFHVNWNKFKKNISQKCCLHIGSIVKFRLKQIRRKKNILLIFFLSIRLNTYNHHQQWPLRNLKICNGVIGQYCYLLFLIRNTRSTIKIRPIFDLVRFVLSMTINIPQKISLKQRTLKKYNHCINFISHFLRYNKHCKLLEWWSSVPLCVRGLLLGIFTGCLILTIILPIWLIKRPTVQTNSKYIEILSFAINDRNFVEKLFLTLTKIFEFKTIDCETIFRNN